MPAAMSRQKIAQTTADSIVAGDTVAIKRLAAHLVDTGRTNEAELIVRDIEQALVSRGIVLVDVASARKLTTEARSAIEDFIKRETGADQVKLREQLDPSLIGGVKMKYGDRMLDASVATKLERLA